MIRVRILKHVKLIGGTIRQLEDSLIWLNKAWLYVDRLMSTSTTLHMYIQGNKLIRTRHPTLPLLIICYRLGLKSWIDLAQELRGASIEAAVIPKLDGK